MEYEKQGDSGLYTRDYFDSLLVETRYIDSGEPDTSFAIYGKIYFSYYGINAGQFRGCT